MISVYTTQEDIDLWKCFTDSTIQFTRILITWTYSIEQGSFPVEIADIRKQNLTFTITQMRKLKTMVGPCSFQILKGRW